MDKSSKERWLKDCERCQGDTRIVLKILRGGREHCASKKPWIDS